MSYNGYDKVSVLLNQIASLLSNICVIIDLHWIQNPSAQPVLMYIFCDLELIFIQMLPFPVSLDRNPLKSQSTCKKREVLACEVALQEKRPPGSKEGAKVRRMERAEYLQQRSCSSGPSESPSVPGLGRPGQETSSPDSMLLPYAAGACTRHKLAWLRMAWDGMIWSAPNWVDLIWCVLVCFRKRSWWSTLEMLRQAWTGMHLLFKDINKECIHVIKIHFLALMSALALNTPDGGRDCSTRVSSVSGAVEH